MTKKVLVVGSGVMSAALQAKIDELAEKGHEIEEVNSKDADFADYLQTNINKSIEEMKIAERLTADFNPYQYGKEHRGKHRTHNKKWR